MMAKFKNPVVQWAHEHPILFALFGTTIFFTYQLGLLGKLSVATSMETQV
ncbi:MAG: hypothetical protein CM15mV57_600 [uncultured marine virus]|nr:MAG: hypothetical protein CM15mV57_600 [uncultured marine virus]